MKRVYFITEKKQEILHDDFVSLRSLYTPVIGKEAVFLYTLLNDYHFINKRSMDYIPFADLAKTMGMTETALLVERKKLEAVGLIRTFEKADNEHFIIRLNKPLSPVMFRKNSLLYKEAVKKVGDLIIERVEFAIKEREYKKDEFKEVTTKFQDIFSLQPKIDQSNTLEMALPANQTKEDAINGLTFAQFIFFITGKKISPSQLSVISAIQNLGLSDKSINIIVDYSFNKNGRVVSNHIKAIAEDLIQKGITSSATIFKELNFIKEAVKQEQQDIIAKQNKLDGVEDSKAHERTTEEWEDLFNALGGL